MKKTFQLNIEGKNRDRVLDAVKHEIRKYIKRERGRDVPAGADYWDFDCKFGVAAGTAQVTHLGNLTGLIDEVAKAGGDQFYVEILAKPGHRKAKPEGGLHEAVIADSIRNPGAWIPGQARDDICGQARMTILPPRRAVCPSCWGACP